MVRNKNTFLPPCNHLSQAYLLSSIPDSSPHSSSAGDVEWELQSVHNSPILPLSPPHTFPCPTVVSPGAAGESLLRQLEQLLLLLLLLFLFPLRCSQELFLTLFLFSLLSSPPLPFPPRVFPLSKTHFPEAPPAGRRVLAVTGCGAAGTGWALSPTPGQPQPPSQKLLRLCCRPLGRGTLHNIISRGVFTRSVYSIQL